MQRLLCCALTLVASNLTATIDVAPAQDTRPDLSVVAIVTDNCGGPSGYEPMIGVTVMNSGKKQAPPVYVDVFFGLPAAPTMGMLADFPHYDRTVTLAGGESDTLWFPVDPQFQLTWDWVDVIVDSFEEVDELLDNNNNIYSAYLWLPYCLF